MKKKVNVKLVIILLIIIFLVITGLVLFFKTDFFRTKRSAFFRYFNQIPEALNVIETDKYKNYNERKENIPYTRKADVTIQTSSNIADSNIMDKLKLTLNEKRDAKNEKASVDISINNSNSSIIKMQGIKNKEGYGFYCADLANGYISVKNEGLKRIAQDSGISNIQLFPNQIKNYKIDKILETTKTEKKHLTECVNIIKNDVPTTAYSKEGKKKIKINDKSYSTNSYKLSLNSSANAELQISLLEKISKDSILMDYITSKLKLLNMNDEYTSINSLNEIMKKNIEQLKNKPNDVGNLEILVYEYKQKNIRTEINIGNQKYILDHLKEDNTEFSMITINNKKYGVMYDGTKYILMYEDTEDLGKKLKIEYSQTGSIENNDIKNTMLITYSSSIKSITYSYSDSISFTNDIGQIADFGTSKVVTLNDYSDDEIKSFMATMKNKINDIYINKGASIGINLDPLFEQ